MTTPADTPPQRAREAIEEHGCPICGIEPDFVWVEDPHAITIDPCGHIVGSEEADYLEWFQDALDGGEVADRD